MVVYAFHVSRSAGGLHNIQAIGVAREDGLSYDGIL
jgi:hypothetical protein